MNYAIILTGLSRAFFLRRESEPITLFEEEILMATKWVYLFKEGRADMKNLLGGKGANLAEMTNLGLPIPQGFTVTTEACTDYYNSGKKITDEIQGQIF